MKKGFTLIEVMLVVTLLGIMIGVYVISGENLSAVAIDGASKKVQSDIRYAQQLAQSRGANHGVNFTASGSTYEVYLGSPGASVLSPVTGQTMIENFDQFPGVSIAADYQVEFNTSGVPIVGGNQGVRLTALSGGIREIYVTGTTGAVVINIIVP